MSPATTTALLSLLITTVSMLPSPSTSAPESFVYAGCSQLKFTPNSPFEDNLNSLLTSLVNSATLTTYNNFTSQAASSSSADTIYGLFQCRGDLSTGDCSHCVARAVSTLGTVCLGSCGGSLQLDACFVRYDNATFLGVPDTSVVSKKCGPPLVGGGSDELTRKEAVLGYLGANDGSFKPYRVAGSGDVYAVAQCVGDLSASECEDCLTAAIGVERTDCGNAAAGDVYLGKCYVRFSIGGSHSHGGNDHNNNDDEIEKTLAILIGLIAGVALLIVFIAFLSKVCEKGKQGGK